MVKHLGILFLALFVASLAASLCVSQDPFTASRSTDEERLEKAQVGTNGPALLDFFRKRTVSAKDRERIGALIRKLGDDAYDVREKATGELQTLGRAAVPALKRAAEDPDLEVARRAKESLQAIEEGAQVDLVLAATRLLGKRKADRAVSVLLGYLPNAPEDRVAETIVETVEQLAVQDGKLDPTLLETLGDQDSVRRAAAALIVARHSPEHRPLVHKLLRDPDVAVRSAAALTLTSLGDKTAVETLVGLLKDAPLDKAWLVEDLLFRLADGPAVTVTLSSGLGTDNRLRCQEAWTKWWNTNKDRIDLAPLLRDQREGTDRVVCQLQGGLQGSGRVFAYGPDDKVRWWFDNVSGPIDVQMQANGHMLLAEINANRVTERDRTGKILWEKKTSNSPMTGQRLSNGNVFIATYTELLEVNPEGKTVWSQQKPDLNIYCAQKLRNGHILFVTSTGLLIELDGEGKEVRSIPAGDTSNWGSVESLPNGHFLVCRCGQHQVVEIDALGKEVWRCSAQWPTWAYQQRNGRVLVACAHSGQVIEFDREGKEVWKQALTGRPCRIRRF